MKERHLLGNVKHEMKKASSSKLDLEESKNAAIDKTTGKNQAKSTSGGWKSRRSSISRLPSSFVMFRDVLWNVSRYSYATIAPGPGAYDLLSCFGAQPRVPTARPRIHQHESVEIVAVYNSM